jgi:hypothetical protein
MEKERLQKILENHKLWLNHTGGERADLSDANLRSEILVDADLRGANLIDADLRGASLISANLQDADLRGANLTDATLHSANLFCAELSDAILIDTDISNAELSRASLTDAYLRSACLQGAVLCGANLWGADLSSANLRGADLRNASLRGASLREANLCDANLDGVVFDETTAFFSLQCPSDGAFVGWKKCANGVIVKLLIPEDAARSSATTRKCRASKAIVLELFGAGKGTSSHDPNFMYEVGKVVVPDSFDPNRWNDCSHGIHFFLTREEAESY